VVGDTTNSFCIDPTRIAPLSQFFSDLTNGTLPSFAFIEAGYGNNDEHPGVGAIDSFGSGAGGEHSEFFYGQFFVEGFGVFS